MESMEVFTDDRVRELRSKLEGSKRIVLTGHRGPDGDAVGACLALWNHLKENGIDSTVVMPDPYPEFIFWMNGHEDIVLHSDKPNLAEELVTQAEVLFVLDYNDSSRVGDLQSALDNTGAFTVMVDHHQMPSDFVDMMFSDSLSCSTCEMIYRLIEKWGEARVISKSTAECIYCGIMTDTGSFRFPSVTPRTHRIAASLLETGMDHSAIHSRVYDNNREGKLKLVGYAISEKLQVFPEFHAAIISLSAEELNRFGYKKGDTEGLVNTALSIEGVNFAAFIHESSERVKMSFRSVGEFSAREFSAKHFGGGGHHNAAGGASQDSLEDVLKKIVSLLPVYSKELNYPAP
ncbi:MAG: DHH family phosphoesterase [Bacteroidetes bacterium]|nr:MAG: DHH family phosphoesterase [Bacteroidota bacterium]